MKISSNQLRQIIKSLEVITKEKRFHDIGRRYYFAIPLEPTFTVSKLPSITDIQNYYFELQHLPGKWHCPQMNLTIEISEDRLTDVQ